MLFNYINLIKLSILFNIKRTQYFKLDALFSFITGTIYIATGILFWYILLDLGITLKGWNFSDVMVFIAFSELFYGIETSIFGVMSRFWRVIHIGQLDMLLIRPLDPRLRFFILNIKLTGLLTAIIKFIIIIIISGKQLNILFVICGILIVLLANTILALIRLFLTYLAFWCGNMDALSELTDSLTQFNKYPLVIFPAVIKFFCMFGFPFYFFSTYPAELVLNKLNTHTLLWGSFCLCFNICFWIILNRLLWKKGRNKYESING